MSANSIVVIGAGISGLSAAHALLSRGARDVTVLDAAARPGGVIATRRENGFVFELGPDSFLTAKPAALSLCRELGLGDRFVGSNDGARKTWIWRHGRLMPLPAGWQMLGPARMAPVLATPLLSPRAKLRLLREWWARPEPFLADEAVARLLRRRFGAETVAAIAAPLLAGVYGGDAEELSAAAVTPRLLELARRGSISRALWRARRRAPQSAPAPLFTTLRDGLDELPAALAARIGAQRLRLHCRVLKLELRAGEYYVQCDGGAGFTAGAVILALPAAAAAPLVEGLDGELARELAAITYSSSLTVNLAFAHEPPLPPGTGALVASGEGLRLLACTFMHRKFPHRAPPGAALLRVFYGGRRDAEAWAMPDPAAIALAQSELRRMFGIRVEPAAACVARWAGAMAQPAVGHLAQLERIEAALARHPNLALAGNAFAGIGIADCIAVGRRAAERILGDQPS